MTLIVPGRRWRHKARGSTYTEFCRGVMQASGSPLDMQPVVIYRADQDGSLWVRPVAEFEDGRFEEIASDDDAYLAAEWEAMAAQGCGDEPDPFTLDD